VQSRCSGNVMAPLLLPTFANYRSIKHICVRARTSTHATLAHANTGSAFMRQCSSSTGEEDPGRGAGGGAVGVIVSSSLASAANCLDECCAMAASQRMNHNQCLREPVWRACSYVHVRICV